MIRSLIIFCFVFFFAFISFAEEGDEVGRENRDAAIQDLIVKLGDDSYVVRERAERQLLRIGMDAFSALKSSLKSEDVEVARRAEQILGQFELIYLGQENESVRAFVDQYTTAPSVAQKATVLWLLANPLPIFGLTDGEGFRSLGRIARFEQERALRVEAVKCLIGLPPIAESKRKKWYRSLNQLFSRPGDDELLQFLSEFAQLRCDVDTLRETTENEVIEAARNVGRSVEYPIPLNPNDELIERTRQWAKSLAEFRTDPENSKIQPGNWVDLMLYHALAELQDDLGMNEERDQTLRDVLALRTEPFRSDNELLPFDPLDGGPFNSHYYVGLLLFERNRLQWAAGHLERVVAEGEISLRGRACSLLSGIEHLRERYPEAIKHIEKEIEILSNKEYSDKLNNAEQQINEAKTRLLSYQARVAADEGKWAVAKESVDEVLKLDQGEVDTLILRYELCEQSSKTDIPGIDEEYRKRMKPLVDGAIGRVERQMREGMRHQLVCNQVAWLLANAGGDYPTAKALIDVAIRLEPETPAYLDTQAHVYALGGEFDKAVEVQEQAIRLAPEATAFRRAMERFQKSAAEKKTQSPTTAE